MMSQVTEEKIREAAAAKIISRRDELFRARLELKSEQDRLAVREREIERELAECRAAAKFFGIDIEPPPDDRTLEMLKERAAHFRLRARESESRGRSEEAAHFFAQAEKFERHMISGGVVRVPLIRSSSRQGQPPSTIPMKSSPQASKPPRIRDIVLDQLRSSATHGLKAAPIQRYIENTYAATLHGKTVGMTLYRLSQEKLVHRVGQTWFYGPALDESPPVESENPGVSPPGPLTPRSASRTRRARRRPEVADN
jgi:hypothetical protein